MHLHEPLSDASAVGAWIRAHRKARHLTLDQLAARADTGVRFLSELERGKETAELGKVLSVLTALGLALAPLGGPAAPAGHPSAPQKPQTGVTPGQVDDRPGPFPGSRPACGDGARLWDMLAAAWEIRELAASRDNDREADAGGMAVRAMERAFEILGEAARRVTPATQARIAHVPWRELVARRNRLVMEYERVDHAALGRAALQEIPALIPALRAALDHLPGA